MDAPNIQYETQDFSEILRKDNRFDPRAYDFMLQVIGEASESAKGHVTGHELLDWFRDFALDADGPLAYTGAYTPAKTLATSCLTCTMQSASERLIPIPPPTSSGGSTSARSFSVLTRRKMAEGCLE